MPKPSPHWKNIEKRVADLLSPVFGLTLKRNPLSGSNNKRDDGTPRRGDITFPNGWQIITEVKYRNSIGFHRFFEQAEDDAEKSNFPLKNALLFSKEKGQKPILATIRMELLLELLEVVRESGKLNVIFGVPESDTKPINKDKR